MNRSLIKFYMCTKLIERHINENKAVLSMRIYEKMKLKLFAHERHWIKPHTEVKWQHSIKRKYFLLIGRHSVWFLSIKNTNLYLNFPNLTLKKLQWIFHVGREMKITGGWTKEVRRIYPVGELLWKFLHRAQGTSLCHSRMRQQYPYPP